jgi:hypothetical protein
MKYVSGREGEGEIKENKEKGRYCTERYNTPLSPFPLSAPLFINNY